MTHDLTSTMNLHTPRTSNGGSLSSKMATIIRNDQANAALFCRFLISEHKPSSATALTCAALLRAIPSAGCNQAQYTYKEWQTVYKKVHSHWVRRNHPTNAVSYIMQVLSLRQRMHAALSASEPDFSKEHDINPVAQVQFCIMTSKPKEPDTCWQQKQEMAFKLVDPQWQDESPNTARGKKWWGMTVLEQVAKTCSSENTAHLLHVAAEIATRFCHAAHQARTGQTPAPTASQSAQSAGPSLPGQGAQPRGRKMNAELSTNWRGYNHSERQEVFEPTYRERQIAATVLAHASTFEMDSTVSEMLTALRVYLEYTDSLLLTEAHHEISKKLEIVADLLESRAELQALSQSQVQLYSAVVDPSIYV